MISDQMSSIHGHGARPRGFGTDGLMLPGVVHWTCGPPLCGALCGAELTAHGGRRGRRSPARVAGEHSGLPEWLRQYFGWPACSVATASAACARPPHHPPWGRGVGAQSGEKSISKTDC